MAGRFAGWVSEAKRRRVFRTVGVYVVAVWGVSSGGVDIAGVLGIPETALRVAIYAAIGAIPLVALLAWRFDIGREGIVRDPQDLLADQQRDADLAAMPTMVGGDEAAGAVLIRWRGPDGDQAALFTEDLQLGRSAECRVRFYDPLVSRIHARIFNEAGVWRIEDLGSRNGTIVDGAHVTRAPLGVDSEIRLNDEGPFLRVELIAPGADTLAALAAHPPGQPTAHVRRARGSAASPSEPSRRR